MKLRIFYDDETDTLSLWNGQPGNEGADVAENLTVDLNSEGEVVGFTLEHAGELLKQVLTSYPKSVTATQVEDKSMGQTALVALVHDMFSSAMETWPHIDSDGVMGFGHSEMFSPSDGTAVWYIASPGAVIQEEIIDGLPSGNFVPHIGTGYVAVAGDIDHNVIDRLLQTAKAGDSPVLLLGMPGRAP